MQEIMSKNSYYKINLLFYRFNSEEQKNENFKSNILDILYDLFDAIKSSILFFCLVGIIVLLSVFLFSFDEKVVTLLMMSVVPLGYLIFMHIYIQQKERKNIIKKVGEEYRDLFLSQKTYSQDFLLKKTILFKNFIDAKKISLTPKEIDLSIQYIKESKQYIGLKLPEILSKIQNFGLLGIWVAALLQKDSITIQNLLTFFEFLVYFYFSIFVCISLYDILFRKPMRDFCFVLITYKELYCRQ